MGRAKQRYLIIAGFIFLGSAGLSFFAFRKFPLNVTAKLAPVEFKDEIPVSATLKGTLRPAQQWPLTSASGGRLESFLVEEGADVIVGQPVAVVGATEAKAALRQLLVDFKASANLLASRGEGPRREEAEKVYQQKRTALSEAKAALEKTLVPSQHAGRFSSTVKPGTMITPGATIATIQDASKFSVLTKIESAKKSEVPSQTTVTVIPQAASVPPLSSIDALAEIKFTPPRSDVAASEAGVEVILADKELLAPLVDMPVQITFALPSLKRVALVDPANVVTQNGEKKILVLNKFGFLHWQGIAEAPLIDNKIAVTGVDRDSFRVVIPENPAKLSQAITANVKPHVAGGG